MLAGCFVEQHRCNTQLAKLSYCAGINLPYYVRDKVRELVLLDVSPGMLSMAQQKATSAPTTFVQGDVQHLPFSDSSFDTVVDTFSFCVYPEPSRAAQEMFRVLAPGMLSTVLWKKRFDISQSLACGSLPPFDGTRPPWLLKTVCTVRASQHTGDCYLDAC
jgi:ubiquinone/menaquinone biosynthesis C-methylase UbiE